MNRTEPATNSFDSYPGPAPDFDLMTADEIGAWIAETDDQQTRGPEGAA